MEAGACIVNDISGGSLDPQLIPEVAALKVPYVLMHIKGNPQTMQQQAVYADVTREVLDQLADRKAVIEKAGIRDCIIDPGFGFGKTAAHNFRLMEELPVFSLFKAPVLLGISRKSFIWKTLGTTPESDDTLQGTTALHMAGLIKGANLLRVHDVKAAAATIKLFLEMKGAG